MVIRKTLKLLNFVMTLAGAAMIFYAWGMYRLWQKDRRTQPFDFPPPPNPSAFQDRSLKDHNTTWSSSHWARQVVSKRPQAWFILAVLCAGIVTCLTSSAGYIAAETSNSNILACYSASLAAVILLQSILAGFLIFDVNWHDALPYDPTGELDTLQAFVNDHFQLCKSLAWSFMGLEGQCIFLALRMLVEGDDPGESDNQDSTDSESALREPLLLERLHMSLSLPASSSSQKQPRINVSSIARSKEQQYEGCAQPWKSLEQHETSPEDGEIQPDRTVTSISSVLHLPTCLTGIASVSTEMEHTYKGKAITSPGTSKSLGPWEDREEGSSLSGISWADLFVDAGEEDGLSPEYEDGNQESEFQV